jgi:hypothetical protein
MGERVIAENTGVESVTYKLPNKHYIPIDMKYIGVDNTTPLSIIRFLFLFVFCFLFFFLTLLGRHRVTCAGASDPIVESCCYSISHDAIREILIKGKPPLLLKDAGIL